MCSTVVDIFGHTSISWGGARDATIGGDRISQAIRSALAEDLTQEDTAAMKTDPNRVTIYHVPQDDPKNRHTMSASSYADSEHVREYRDYLTSSIFLTQHS